MKNLEIEKIIIKFINQEVGSNELKELELWLKNDENAILFSEYVKIEYLTANYLGNYNVEKAKTIIKARIKINKKKRNNIFFRKMSIAASIIILLGFSFFNYFDDNNSENHISAPKTTEIVSNKTILTLGNGKNIDLNNQEKYLTNKVKGNSKELFYSQKDAPANSNKQLTYNYLTIPRGVEFFIKLSDGTKVWLNADSKLKYPESFKNGESRKVELLYGEAYFEVSSSEMNNGDSFHVITKNQEVNVLGTHFNVKAYKEDSLISTTLLEGKVSINDGLNTVLLKPNQQSRISDKTKMIEVLNVDVSQEVAWIKGLFSFNEEPLDEIMKVLSRRYNVKVIFKSEEIKKYQFTGILERKTKIQEILKFFESISNGDLNFILKDGEIIVK